MKRINLIIALLFTFAIGTLSASALEGLWKSQISNKTIRVKQVRDGIKVKAAGRSDWSFYQAIGDAYTFEDHRGQRFYFYDYDGVLEWKERYASHGVPFVKITNHNQDWNGHHHETHYYDDDYYVEEHHYHHEDRYSIYGQWRSYNTNDRLHIKYARSGVIAKLNGKNWDKYRAISGNKFLDRRGNVIKILDRNRILWKSHCGRYRTTFERNNYRNHPSRGGCRRGY